MQPVSPAFTYLLYILAMSLCMACSPTAVPCSRPVNQTLSKPIAAPEPAPESASAWPGATLVSRLSASLSTTELAALFPRKKLVRNVYQDECFGDYFGHPLQELFVTSVMAEDKTELFIIHTLAQTPTSDDIDIIAVSPAAGESINGLEIRVSRYADVKRLYPDLVCHLRLAADCQDSDGATVLCAALQTPYLFAFELPIKNYTKIGSGGFVQGDPGGRLTEIYWAPLPYRIRK